MASGLGRTPGKGVAVRGGVAVGVGAGVAVGVGVAVGAGAGVAVGVGVAVGAAEGEAVGNEVAVSAGVAGGGDRSSAAPLHATRTLAAVSAAASKSGAVSARRLSRIGGLAPSRGYTPP